MGKPIMLLAEHGAVDCVIDCEGADLGFHFFNGEDERSVLRGVTIKNGYAMSAGAILCEAASPSIQHCVLTANGVPSISAVSCQSASPVFHHCTLAGNKGSGIYGDDASAPKLVNCILWNNAGVSIKGGNPEVMYSCIEGGFIGEGNLWADPLFRDADAGNYHLESDSSCIDAGTNISVIVDMDGDLVWDDPAHSNVVGFVDIGADEYIDVDQDGMADWWEILYWGHLAHDGTLDSDTVGGRDGLTDLQEYWNGTDPDAADSNNNGVFDGDEDADADGLNVAEELNGGTAPLHPDSDKDGFADGEEVLAGTDPLNTLSLPDGTTADAGVVINEVLYHVEQGYQFVELFNASTSSVDISAYTISCGIFSLWTNAVIPTNTIVEPNSFYLVGAVSVRDVAERQPDLRADLELKVSHIESYAAVVLLNNEVGIPVDSMLYGHTNVQKLIESVPSSFLISPCPAVAIGSSLSREMTGQDHDEPEDWVARPTPGPKSSDDAQPGSVQDIDNDGISNDDEILLGTDMFSPDTDEDGIPDGQEVAEGLDPTSMDTDGDGLYDLREITLGTDPLERDTDHDGLWDSTEIHLFLNPNLVDSDGNGTDDVDEDSDLDGYNNGVEQDGGYDPGSDDSSPMVGHNEIMWGDGSAQWEIPLKVVVDKDGAYEERLRPFDKCSYKKWTEGVNVYVRKYFVQDFERQHTFHFFNVLDEVPAYFRVTRHTSLKNAHFSYRGEGMKALNATGDVRYYATLIGLGGKTVRFKEILKQTKVNSSGHPLYHWPKISIEGPFSLYVNGLDSYAVNPTNKETSGLFVGLNNDDDDDDDLPDFEDTHIIDGDDDLIPVVIKHPAGLPIDLQWDKSIIRLYEHPTKKLCGRYSAEVGACTKDAPYLGYDDQIVYVEGIKKGTTYLKLIGPGFYNDRIKITVVEVDIALDGNRDDAIDFDDPDDKEYLFWVNDDFDNKHYDEGMWQQDDQVGEPDANDIYIGNSEAGGENGCERDLEDFARLHLCVDDQLVGMPGITYHLKFETTNGTSPAINIFAAVDPGSDYLSDSTVAASQILQERLATVSASEAEIDIAYILPDDQPSPFLIEGKTIGKGELIFIVKANGDEVYRTSVSLELHDIDWFYDVYKTHVSSGERWEVQVQSSATKVNAASYVPETNEKFLLVHGWNMTETEKIQWIQTVFKRLWWQGYQGSVALFSWPTLSEYGGFWDVITQPQHFDNSEFRSWCSADALIGVFNTLNASGKLRVMAHSMGNIVAGEAIRRYSGGHDIHTYIAAQAALSAHFYDNTISATHPINQWVYGLYRPLSTPDVFGHYYSGEASTSPYHAQNDMHVSRMLNYFNEQDWALDLWEMNNVMKPDSFNPYFFDYNGREDQYQEGVDSFYRGPVEAPLEVLSLANQRHRYQVFSYIAESRSKALGQARSSEFIDVNLATEFGFDGQHYSHSREFRSYISAEWDFWARIMSDCFFGSSIP